MAKWLVLDQPAGSELVRLATGKFLRLAGGVPVQVDDDEAERLTARYQRIVEVGKPDAVSAAEKALAEQQAAEEAEAKAESAAEAAREEAEKAQPDKHDFQPDRGGVDCLVCEQPIDAHAAKPAPKAKAKKAPKRGGAITTSDLTSGGRNGSSRRRS